MMKRALVGIALAAMVIVPASSQAQRRASASQPIRFALGAGVAVPMSDFADAVGTGFHLEGTGSKQLNGSAAFLRGELGAAMYGSKTYGGGVSGKGNQLGAVADIGYNFASTSSLKPYVLGGLGLHRTSVTVDLGSGNGSQSDNNTAMGFNAGAGMRFKMGAHVAYLEGRYMNNGSWQGANIASFPIAFGVEF
jgi:hypothetical protein